MQTNNLAMAFSEEQGMLLDSAREFCRDRSDIAAVRALRTVGRKSVSGQLIQVAQVT